MAKGRKRKGSADENVEAYRHEIGKRKIVVSAVRASYDSANPKPKRYDYDPHLNSKLIWSGKKEDASFKVPMVLPHIHKRIAPEAKLND